MVKLEFGAVRTTALYVSGREDVILRGIGWFKSYSCNISICFNVWIESAYRVFDKVYNKYAASAALLRPYMKW
jgi:hypothetical protein